MYPVFKYILYFFAFVFVLNIIIQLIVGEAPPRKVRVMKAEMKRTEQERESFSPLLPQKEYSLYLFGVENIQYQLTGVSNIAVSAMMYLDHFAQKIARGIYVDFVAPFIRFV